MTDIQLVLEALHYLTIASERRNPSPEGLHLRVNLEAAIKAKRAVAK